MLFMKNYTTGETHCTDHYNGFDTITETVETMGYVMSAGVRVWLARLDPLKDSWGSRLSVNASGSECFQDASKGGGGLFAPIKKSFKTGEGEFGEEEPTPLFDDKL